MLDNHLIVNHKNKCVQIKYFTFKIEKKIGQLYKQIIL